MNRVELRGRLTRPPEFQVTRNGASLLTATVVVPSTPRWDKETDKDVSLPNFIAIQAWGKTAEYLDSQRLEQGEIVYVIGELSQSEWEDKDGKKQSKTRVAIHWLQTLESPMPRMHRGMKDVPTQAEPEKAADPPF